MPSYVSPSSVISLLQPRNTVMVTCCDEKGKANIITIAWIMPISMDPPLLGISVHPQRYSFDLIRATGEYVVNVVPYSMAKEALYCGRVSGRDEDKFTAAQLTPAPARMVQPPIIKECISHLECRMVQDIEAGDHHIFVGKILDAYTKGEHLSTSGGYDLEAAAPLFHMGGDTFITIGGETITPKI